MSEKLQKFKNLKNDKNFIRVIYIIGIVGIALIFCSTFFGNDDNDTGDSLSYSVNSYREDEELRIKEMVESIEGVGTANVMLTMENGGEQVYSQDNRVKEIEPVVRGALVVCTGGNDPEIREIVLESVTKALNISADKVCVTKLKKE